MYLINRCPTKAVWKKLQFKLGMGESLQWSTWDSLDVFAMLKFKGRSSTSSMRQVRNVFLLARALNLRAISCIVWRTKKLSLAKMSCLMKMLLGIGGKKMLKECFFSNHLPQKSANEDDENEEESSQPSSPSSPSNPSSSISSTPSSTLRKTECKWCLWKMQLLYCWTCWSNYEGGV